MHEAFEPSTRSTQPVPEAGRWQSLAACVKDGVDPELFFSGDSADTARARVICDSCQVAVQCLKFALKNGIPYGVYGGMTPGDRAQRSGVRRLRR